MKRILFATLLFVLLGPGSVFASWQDEFLEKYEQVGLDRAVAYALDNDVSPAEILAFIGSSNVEFSHVMIMKALYCAGASRESVKDGADTLGVTIKTLSLAVEESHAECNSKFSLSDQDVMRQSASPAASGGNSRIKIAVEESEAIPPIIDDEVIIDEVIIDEEERDPPTIAPEIEPPSSPS